METLFLNIAKSSGLIAIFFIAYYLLLRKETFFSANRWFLLAGLFTAVILPWIVFTTIVWVDPASANTDWSNIPSTPIQEQRFEINWVLVLAGMYIIGFLAFVFQFVFDFYNLNQVLKDKKAHRQADHKYIDVQENIAPFSYFNTIVYNSSLYSESEMQSILEHEKVHSDQYHTIDVLITRVFCILFWFNPFVWWYKKAILQNLEFIADSEALKNISNKKAYQLTLLKITTHESWVVITNHFYQSLIKKRIVMLNKNQSKKRNFLKYALVIPVLVAFVFVFQMEVIAKEKDLKIVTANTAAVSNDADIYKVTKNSTEAELKETAAAINNNYGLTVRFSGTKRNADDELIAVSVEVKKGSEMNQKRVVKSSEPIKTFAIIISKEADGKINVDFKEEGKTNEKIVVHTNGNNPVIKIDKETKVIIDGDESSKEEMDKLNPDDIATVNVIKNNEKKEIRIVTSKRINALNENEIYINDKRVSAADIDELDPNVIESMDVNKKTKTIKIITKNGAYLINDNKISPAAPTPPVPPVAPTAPVLKNNTPAFPALPSPPAPPKGNPVNGDKKAWNDYEKKMNDYEAKMEKLQPQIEAYEKKMADFEKQMKPFEKQMAEYEKQMKVYEKQLEKYFSEIEN
ncbi:M56 family metallopeptidase [Flavobacterium sp. W22_SRS_FK3]|uniref:M56 family metallopeptidase n=1 Tax=Flavobacterium sp. W22_SRS_FK3 TaxID=3240275 RepID=UPI003F921A3D